MSGEKLIPIQEVMFTPVPALAKPIVIVSEATASYIQKCLENIDSLEIVDEATNQRMAELLNHLSKAVSVADAEVLSQGKPFRDESARIRELGNSALAPGVEGQTRASDKLVAWKRLQEAEAAKQRAERDRLEAEAKVREEESVKQLDSAKTEKGFERAAVAFDKSLAVATAAKVLAPIVAKKPKGVKEKRTPIIEKYDLKLLPVTYHKLDEAKLKKHILDGTITSETPGIKFRIKESFGGTGR